jgi:6-phosphogluconolactonase
MNHDLRRFADAAQAAEACARQILDWLRAAIDERGLATLAISGGSSPRPMFESFAKARFEWDRVHLFWVDERGVPPTDPQSNYRLAEETWLGPSGFPRSNIHRVEAELPAGAAAQRYAGEIRRFFGLPDGELPRFDVMHLGMGPDAHTASLFPGDPLVANRGDIAAALWVEKFQQWRITLLPGVLLAARHTAMLVTEPDRAGVLREVLRGPADPMIYPAQLASREGTVWFVNAAAAEESE